MAQKTSQKTITDEEIRQNVLAGLSVTGLMLAEVQQILLDESKKLNPVIFNKIAPLIQEERKTWNNNLEDYIIAYVEKNEPEMQRLREKQFISDTNVLNTLMYNGASHIIEKMQDEAIKHTQPNKAGRKFNMFHAVHHNAIYYPNDIELLYKNGYNFDRTQWIGDKEVDFTQYNLDTIHEENNSFATNVNGLYEELERVLPERNRLIEQYQKLEEEREKASNNRKKSIEREMEELDTKYQTIMDGVNDYRLNAEIDLQDVISCRQRLLNAVELNCVSPENIQKIKDSPMDFHVKRLQINYNRFNQVKNLLDGVSANSTEQQQHLASAKPFTDLESQNSTLANASNNEPIDKTNIQAVQKQQLGTTVNLENEDLAIHQTQQATKF